MKKIIALSLSSLFVARPSLASSFYKIDSPTDSYTASSNNYEIYNTSYSRYNDRVKLTIDTNVPLSGHNESGALDGHVGHTDIRVKTDTATYSIKFAPNENQSPIGIYKNPSQASVVKSNFGRDAGNAITKLYNGELVTDDIKVYEFTNAGHNNSNRIVIDFPESALGNEDKLLHLTVECGNDSIELFVPKIKTDIDIDMSLPEVNIPFPEINIPEIETSEESESVMKYLIPTALIVLLLTFLGSGNSINASNEANKQTFPELNVNYNTDYKTLEERQEVPESPLNMAIFVLGVAFVLSLRKN